MTCSMILMTKFMTGDGFLGDASNPVDAGVFCLFGSATNPVDAGVAATISVVLPPFALR